MESIFFLSAILPRTLIIEPIAAIALALGLVAMLAGYLHRLAPPFMIKHSPAQKLDDSI